MGERVYKYDNIRGILIFLVVLGHAMGAFSKDHTTLLAVIYSFHMPAFVFLNGYFAKRNLKRAFFNIFLPFLFFSVVLWIFDLYVWKSLLYASQFVFENPLVLFVYPIGGMLWYLESLFIWSVMLFVFCVESKRSQIIIFLLSCVISICCGFFDKVGIEFSLSNTIVLLPFFLYGQYRLQLFKCNTNFKFGMYFLAAVLMSLLLAKLQDISGTVIVGSYVPYSNLGIYYAWCIRVVFLLGAFFWITALVHIIPNRKLFIVSSLGAFSFAVYLFHGLILFSLEYLFINRKLEADFSVITLVIFSLLICAFFGNKYFYNVFHWMFSFCWLEKLFIRKKETCFIKTFYLPLSHCPVARPRGNSSAITINKRSNIAWICPDTWKMN